MKKENEILRRKKFKMVQKIPKSATKNA